MMKPDAVSSICHKIERDWGSDGYSIREISEGPIVGTAIAEVWASDGSFFWIGADRWGNTTASHTDRALAWNELIQM